MIRFGSGSLKLKRSRGTYDSCVLACRAARCARSLASYLPPDYVKSRGVEKVLAEEHRKWFEVPAADLKLKYVRKCRSLPTYGITFFLVKVLSSS